MLLLTLSIGFVIGAISILAVEALGIIIFICRLNRRLKKEEAKAASKSHQGASGDPVASCYNIQGFIYVLESESVPKTLLVEKVPRENKRNKEFLEVTPARKYAQVKYQSLILTETDGCFTEIPLKECTVAAVSATSSSSRKWAKRYPIKVESKTSVLYHGSKVMFIYLKTSWEKESWCKALRLASCNDKEKREWFARLKLEFRTYLASLNTRYPLFMKPLMGIFAEPIGKTIKIDGGSSKVRHFLKKLAKKASKSGLENKAGGAFTSGSEVNKLDEKSRSFQASGLGSGLVNNAFSAKVAHSSAKENSMRCPLPNLTHSGSSCHSSEVSEADSDEKIVADEGTLCWNLLLSRLFFDAKSGAGLRSSLKARIQRTLSNMRSPSFIGEVTCTGVDPGNLPPYIHSMRVLPSDMNEVWALEIDVDYSGGAVLEIETRLEVQELDLREGMVDADFETSSIGEVTPDLLEGLEYVTEQLNLSMGTADVIERKDEGDQLDEIRSGKSSAPPSSCASKWKSILHSVARQVSQVPLSLGIRVASLRGTMRLHIKPPPSDQLWYGFTSMPDIDFNVESFVGEHKITSGHIALFLISRLKAGIRESLVLPNCESVCIPWMLAEKDDWVPRKVAPFIWISQDATAVKSTTDVHEAPCCHGDEGNRMADTNRGSTSGSQKGENDEEIRDIKHPIGASRDTCSSLVKKSTSPLQSPLLNNDDPVGRCKEESPECQLSSRGVEEDDGRPKRMGTKAKMLGLGKKMGEMLEERKRHIEEKGRNIVERIRDHKNA